jgi:DNA-binding FrmR family transcriptional regulator
MEHEKRQAEIIRRLKSVEGHVRGIQRMVEEGQYCIDVINQTSAVHAALDKVNALILERHLQTCVATAIQSDSQAERERVIGELLQVFQGTKRMMSNE